MLDDYLSQPESKLLEFKENAKNLNGIIKTIIAFANTAGGILIIGVQDKTKEILGIPNVLKEEERLASAIVDSIAPLLVPDIEIHTSRERELIIVRVPHAAGPFYLKSEGPEKGVYIRFGSTNRVADQEMFSALKLFSMNLTFDELPQIKGRIDWPFAKNAFKRVKKNITEKTAENLGIVSTHSGKSYPTTGGILLFGANRLELFPDSIIRCARFAGSTREKILDQTEIVSYLPVAVQEAITFVNRNTKLEGRIGKIVRKDIAEYPPLAMREGIINALLHADYSMKGCHIQIAIFEGRTEITNPGGLPFGQTMQKALSGFSRLRNRVLGRVFRELNLIEQWGSGLQRIIAVCQRQGLKPPEFEEFNNQFRLTLFSTRVEKITLHPWEEKLIEHLKITKSITPQEVAKLWKISDRGARTRLKIMIEGGIIQRIGTSTKDPRAKFILRRQDIEQ